MIEVKRELFMLDPVYHKVYTILKQHHKVADHTKKTLLDNQHVKNFCEEARHFMIMPGKTSLFIHYDVSSWYHSSDGALVKIDSITFYDDFMEYETARLKQLHGAKTSDIPNIN